MFIRQTTTVPLVATTLTLYSIRRKSTQGSNAQLNPEYQQHVLIFHAVVGCPKNKEKRRKV